MIFLRFREPFEEDWTTVSFEGDSAFAARNILATRLISRDDEVEFADEDSDDFYPAEEEES